MSMLQTSILLFFFLFPIQKYLTKVNDFAIEGDQFAIDAFQNIYSIHQHQIIKYNSKGLQKEIYGTRNNGNIHHIDVSNPLQILIFYKDFNQIIYLDKYLSPIKSPIKLSTLGHDEVACACNSSKGGFWIFDNIELKLFYYNSQLKQVYSSIQLTEIIENHDALQIIEKNGYVYLLADKIGILAFDPYAAYLKTYPAKEIKEFQVSNNAIIYPKDGILFFTDYTTLTQEKIKISDAESFKSIKYIDNTIYTFNENICSEYKLVMGNN